LEGHEDFLNGLPDPSAKILKKGSVKAHNKILRLQQNRAQLIGDRNNPDDDDIPNEDIEE
jgi:hypothetical protein